MADVIVVGGRALEPDGRPRQARCADRRAAAPRLDAGRAGPRPGGRADRGRDRGRTRRRVRAPRPAAAGRRGGRCRRGAPPGLGGRGVRRPRALGPGPAGPPPTIGSCSSTTGRGRAIARPGRGGRSGGPPARGRPSRSCPWPRPSSGSTAISSSRRSSGPSSATAQTPQGVRHGLLRAAYDRFPPHGPETWTDEAALLEACKIPVHVVPGDPSNLKVTLPADLPRAEVLLTGCARRPERDRARQHPFGPGEPLALGGIVIAGAPRLHGHSDGDVALHAVCDALLGASGLGDLGRLFPAGSGDAGRHRERGAASPRSGGAWPMRAGRSPAST